MWPFCKPTVCDTHIVIGDWLLCFVLHIVDVVVVSPYCKLMRTKLITVVVKSDVSSSER